MEFDVEGIYRAVERLRGSQWVYRGWEAGKAVDCLYSAIYILQGAGVVDNDIGGRVYYQGTEGYGQKTCPLTAYYKSILHISRSHPQTGALVLFKNGKFTSHVGVVVDEGIAHIMSGQQFRVDPIKYWGKWISAFYTPYARGYKADPSKMRICDFAEPKISE